MSKRILVPVDGSEQAEKAVSFVAEEFPGSTVVLFHVINPAEAGYSAQGSLPSFSEEWFESEKARAETIFEDLAAEAATAVDVEHRIEVGRPTKLIVETATEGDVDQIVMGSHGRSGVSRMLLGSVAENVVRRSPVPVTVVH